MKTEKRSLNDCLSLVIDRRGVTPKKLGSDWTTEGYPVLSANNVKSIGLQKINDLRYVSQDVYQKWMKNEIQRGDILLTSEAPAGQVYVWDSDKKIVIGQRLYALRVKKDVNPWFLAYYLRSPKGQAEIINKCSGSTVFGISAKTFDHIEIVLPEKGVQDKIASALKSIEKKIKTNIMLEHKLESLARLIYDYWFIQFDFPDENGRPYKSSGGKMVWNEALNRELPNGWNVVRLGDIITSERGMSYSTENIKTEEGVPMINLASFQPGEGRYKYAGIKYYHGDYSKDKVLKPFDLIMCNTQQTAIDFATDIIGRAMLVPDIFDRDVVYSHHITAIKPINKNIKSYLLNLFNSNYFHRYISGFTNGTNILGLLFNGVEDYLLEVPPDNLLEKFDAIEICIEKQRSELMKENLHLSSLRDFLLPLLMNGQVTFNN